MRILAGGIRQGTCGVVAAVPEAVALAHRGRSFLFDVNTNRLGLLDGDEPRDFAQAIKPICMLARSDCPGGVCLNVTSRCNLACKYCMVSQDSERSRECTDMELQTVIDGIAAILPSSLWRNPAKRKIGFSFFGGEPLLKLDLMKQVVRFIRRFVPVEARFHVTTNGTLLDDDTVRYLRAERFSTIVSIDGGREAHDDLRTHSDGRGSFDRVLAGLRNLRRLAPDVVKSTTLRGTFTADSLHRFPLAERLEFLNDLCDRGMGNHVSVEPAFLGEASCVDPRTAKEMTPNPNDGKSLEFWEAEYAKAADWWLKRFNDGKKPRFHHFNMYLKRLVMGAVHFSECGAGKGYFTLGPDGTIYACHRESNTKLGHVNEGGIDHELAAPWQDNRYYSRLKCPTCPIRNLCGGGCRETSSSAGLGVAMPVPAACAMTTIMVKNAWWILSELPDTQEAQKRLASVVGVPRKRCR